MRSKGGDKQGQGYACWMVEVEKHLRRMGRKACQFPESWFKNKYVARANPLAAAEYCHRAKKS